MSTPFLVLYRDRLDLNDNATQLIFVVYVIGILATLMVAGQLSDSLGRRRVMIPALALSAIASVCLIVGRDSYGFLLTGRVLLGIVSGASLGVGAAWIQELMGPGNEMRAALITTVVTYGGFGLGPPISAAYESLGPSPLVVPYLLHIVVTLAVIPMLLGVPETVNLAGRDRRWKPGIQFGVPPAARKAFVWALAPAAVLVFSFPSTSFALFPVLVSDAVGGRDVLVAGLAGTITSWSALVARPFMGQVDTGPALTWGAAIGTAGLALGTVAFSTDVWPLVLPASFLLGAASGILATACLTLVGQMTDQASRGALTSTFFLLAYLGMSLPLVVTAIGGAVGLVATLIGVTCVAGLIAATMPLRRRIAGW